MDKWVLKAARKVDYERIIHYVLLGGNINARDEKGQTMGHIAAANLHSECPEVYMKLGGDMLAKDKDGNTVIGLAYKKGTVSLDYVLSYLEIDTHNITMDDAENYMTNGKYDKIIIIRLNNVKNKN